MGRHTLRDVSDPRSLRWRISGMQPTEGAGHQIVHPNGGDIDAIKPYAPRCRVREPKHTHRQSRLPRSRPANQPDLLARLDVEGSPENRWQIRCISDFQVPYAQEAVPATGGGPIGWRSVIGDGSGRFLREDEVFLHPLDCVEIHFKLTPEAGHPVAGGHEALGAEDGHACRTRLNGTAQGEKGGERD